MVLRVKVLKCMTRGSEVGARWAGKVLPSGTLTHSCAAPGQPVLPGESGRMQPVIKVPSKRALKRKCAESLRTAEKNF